MPKGGRCFIKGCNSKSDAVHHVGFFRFPPNEWLRRIWVNNVFPYVRDPNWNGIPQKVHVICSAHFSKKCFSGKSVSKMDGNGAIKRTRVKINAVPTIFSSTKLEDDKSHCASHTETLVNGPTVPGWKPVSEELLSQLPACALRSGVTRNIPIRELNAFLTCGLCFGYLYEASTITECMHTFCKPCLVRHCQTNLCCPHCDLAIHPTDPFVNIRPDHTLQDVVDKVLPEIALEEQRREDQFYKEWKRQGKPLPKGHIKKKKIKRESSEKPNSLEKPNSPRDQKRGNSPARKNKTAVCYVSLVLEYVRSQNCIYVQPLLKKFIRVTAQATIFNVACFLKKQLGLAASMQVRIGCDEDCMEYALKGNFTLQDIQELYFDLEAPLLTLYYTVSYSPHNRIAQLMEQFGSTTV